MLTASANAGSASVLSPCSGSSRSGTRPPAGRIGQRNAKSSSSRIPSQKFGMPSATAALALIARSTHDRGRSAAKLPSDRAIRRASASAAALNSIVAG